jgi:hypothetical protein
LPPIGRLSRLRGPAMAVLLYFRSNVPRR